MKVKSLYFPLAALIVTNGFADADNCLTEEDQIKISDQMTNAIANLSYVQASISGLCTNGTFICPVPDPSDVPDKIQGAIDLFDTTIADYNGIIDEGYNPTCPSVFAFCNCGFMTNATNFILTDYNSTYLQQWNQYIMDGQSDCYNRTVSLRALVGNYYCIANDLLTAWYTCPSRCQPCTNDADFLTNVTDRMDVVNPILTAAVASLETFCPSSNLTLTCEIKGTLTIDLIRAQNLLNETMFIIASANDIPPPEPCDAVTPVCDCANIIALCNNITASLADYNAAWNDYISDRGRDAPCGLLVRRMISDLSDLFCYTDRLRGSIDLCPCGLPNPTLVFNYFGRLWSAFLYCGPNRLNGRCTEY